MSDEDKYGFYLDSGEEVGGALGTGVVRFLAMREAYDNQRTIHVYLLRNDSSDYMFTVDYERV